MKQSRNMKQTSFQLGGRTKYGETQSKRGRPRIRPVHSFGGSYFQNYNPREERPIFSKQALHLVLRSSMAQGRYSMRRSDLQDRIWTIVKKHADLNGVTIYDYANAGHHLHLLIRVKRRDFYQKFIRSITGLIARAVKNCERGRPLKGKFWDARPFSRVVQFAGREYQKVKLYFARNHLEALGFIKYVPRTKSNSEEWARFWQYYVSVPSNSVIRKS